VSEHQAAVTLSIQVAENRTSIGRGKGDECGLLTLQDPDQLNSTQSVERVPAKMLSEEVH
jgi:hypothetical protein